MVYGFGEVQLITKLYAKYIIESANAVGPASYPVQAGRHSVLLDAVTSSLRLLPWSLCSASGSSAYLGYQPLDSTFTFSLRNQRLLACKGDTV